ncbi:MAG: AAA family ATPase [Desulfobacterales bacterium]
MEKARKARGIWGENECIRRVLTFNGFSNGLAFDYLEIRGRERHNSGMIGSDLKNSETVNTPTDPAIAFMDALHEAGYNLPESPVPDGEIHRFRHDDRSGGRSGWYVLHGDGIPAGSFGDWKSGQTFTWCGKSEFELTPEQRAEYRLRIEQHKQAREQETARKKAKAAEEARQRWNTAKPETGNHPYLQRKGVRAYGLKREGDLLLIPVLDASGLSSLQTIDADGEKLFLTGGRKKGCSFTIKGDDSNIYITEGYATGATIHEATGCTVLVAFDAGNLLPVAQSLRTKHSGAKIVICADDDRWKPEIGNAGIENGKAAAKAVGAELISPRFKDLSTQPTDFNDLAVLEGIEAVRLQLRRTRPPLLPPARSEMVISETELSQSAISPPCIVLDYLFCDVGTVAAPGGTGKTTILLREIVSIILERPLYGLDVLRPGWCLYVTAEDPREVLVARLREIMTAMELTDRERRAVMDGILIWDVSGETARLINARDGNIELTPLADNIVTAYRDDPPVMTVFDPAISFGAGESYINDNEQGLITAGRRIMRGLGCCVRYVAHTGKLNARGKTLDQYTSRGGSALSDGARMVTVLQSWTPGDDMKPPAGCTYSPDSSITILARPKLSYAPGNQPRIWIKRTGWSFEHFTEFPVSEEEQNKALFDQVERFLCGEVTAGHRHNKTSLETALPDIKRSDARRAIEQLIAQGRVIEADLPPGECKTKRKTYLTVAAGFGGIAENEVCPKVNPAAGNNAAALRENLGGIIQPPDLPMVPNSAGSVRQDSAGLAGLDGKDDDEVLL